MSWEEWKEKYWTQEMRDDVVYDFPAPKGFEDRYRVEEMLELDIEKTKNWYHKHFTPELTQCPKCEVYTDNPEHWCGSVALVVEEDTPRFQRLLMSRILQFRLLLRIHKEK